MKPIKWNTISGYDAWKDTLSSLLAAAAVASANNDDDERLDICDALSEFVGRSGPSSTEIMALDQIASDAVRAMTEKIAADAVGRISARTTSLLSLAKQVTVAADQADKDAASLRLTKFHTVIDALTQAQRAIDGLDDVFDSGTDDELKAKVKTLIDAIKKASTALEKNK